MGRPDPAGRARPRPGARPAAPRGPRRRSGRGDDPGVELGEAPLTVDETQALGAALRRKFDVPATVLTGLPDRIWGASSGLGHLRARADEARDAPPEAAKAVDAARAWLADRARDERVRTNPDPVLGRADGNLANVLFDGRDCRLVDFEDCGISDPAYEVAELLEHVSARLPRLIDADALVRAVGLTDAQAARCTDYRRLFAIYWLLMLLPDGPAHHRNPPGSLVDQSAHVLRLLEEHGPSR